MMDFPLGSSKRSIVEILSIIQIPKARMEVRRRPAIRPDKTGAEKKPSQSFARPNFPEAALFPNWTCGERAYVYFFFAWTQGGGVKGGGRYVRHLPMLTKVYK